MKKIVLLACVLLMLGLSSCSKNEKIYITAENVEDYFAINYYMTDYQAFGDSFATCNVNIEITPLENVKTENLEVTVQLQPSWRTAEQKESQFAIFLPQNGEMKRTISCIGSVYRVPIDKSLTFAGYIIK